MQELSLQHISNILWAFASLWVVREPLASAFVAEVQLRLAGEDFNAQQLCNLLWSLCIAGQCNTTTWRGLVSRLAEMGAGPYAELPEEALTQIYQVLAPPHMHASRLCTRLVCLSKRL